MIGLIVGGSIGVILLLIVLWRTKCFKQSCFPNKEIAAEEAFSNPVKKHGVEMAD